MLPVRIAAVVEVTLAEGPGARLAVWVQGCAIRCPGCCNPHMFDPAGGLLLGTDELLSRVDRVRDRIEGVTLLGGEPFEQAAALAPFAREVRRRGLTVAAFSGHPIEDLGADRPPGSVALLAEVDLLVDGPYVAALPERERRWAGSANQRFHFLSGRIPPGVEWIGPAGPERTIELRIGADGTMERSGWPEE